ncbi:uncharacterized protein PRCAT00004580001 [Priceomyces carsonii]|uniref:uncharacterized protein n=1 Tax=Priceomyces carsonii TaxID=28549 RepID=UPI002EDAED47|nr:unnamed protein product [Priceomyces carsonii]
MIRFLIEKFESGEFKTTEGKRVIDLGTGNGHLLFQLHEDFEEEGLSIQFEYCGIDYSPASVKFAQEIADKQYSEVDVKFEQADLLLKSSPFIELNKGKFDILLDKGTLDAIALNQNPLTDFGGKLGMDVYASQVSQLMHKSSVLLITSCNFTEEELIKIISEDKSTGLSVWDKINYPSIKFGGQTGSTICTIAFIKH